MSNGRRKPNNGQDVFIAQINTLAGVEEKKYFIHQYWCDSGNQNQLLELGVLFTSKDEAISKTKSLLGIESQDTEWKNGDKCVYRGESAVVIGHHPKENTVIIDSVIYGLEPCDVGELSKPETPQQKAEREKRDEAREMIQCILDNYDEFDESATDYVIDYLKECYHLGK